MKFKNIICNKYLVQLLLTLVLTGLLIAIPMQFLFLDPVSRAFENFSLADLYQQIMHNNDLRESNEIYILDVTEVKGRDHMADVLQQLDRMKPKVIGLDILFRNPKSSDEDVLLQQTINSLESNLVFGYELSPHDGNIVHSFFIPSDSIEQCGGYTNTTVTNNNSECLRTFAANTNIEGKTYTSFPSKIVEAYDPSKTSIITSKLTTNYTDVLIKVIPPEEISPILEDKIVLVGVAKGKEDLFWTPIGNKNGVVIHAYSIHNLIHGNYIKESHWFVSFIVSLAIALFAIMVYNRLNDRFKNIPNVVFTIFLWLYLFLLVFINLIVSFCLNMAIPFTIAFVSLVFVSTAYELEKFISNNFKK